jgi:hypothetical protein
MWQIFNENHRKAISINDLNGLCVTALLTLLPSMNTTYKAALLQDNIETRRAYRRSRYSGRKITQCLSYVTVTGEGKIKRVRVEHEEYN